MVSANMKEVNQVITELLDGLEKLHLLLTAKEKTSNNLLYISNIPPDNVYKLSKEEIDALC
jgi:hypothetical protein